MNVLVIDYLSPVGHKRFDRIHIDALLSIGDHLTIVGRKGHFDVFKDVKDVSFYDIPDWSFVKLPIKPLTNRILEIIRLIWISLNFRFLKYDRIIFLSYDVLSLSFCRKRGIVYIINHNNVSQLNNRIKLFLTRLLPSNYIHIALNEYIFERLRQLLPEKNIFYIPHGVDGSIKNLQEPAFIVKERYIFCPVNRNYDESLLTTIVNSDAICDFLLANNIVLFLKSKNLNITNRGICNIRVIDNYLKDEEYNYLMSNAIAVLLPYGNEFKYRCSGILFECLGFNTPIIASDIPDLRIYEKSNLMYYFYDVTSFQASVEQIIKTEKKICNLNLYDPSSYWEKVFNCVF